MNRTLENVHHYDVDTETVCYSCRAKQLVEREDRKKFEKEQVGLGQPKHDEGRIYTVREMKPEEVERHGG